MKRFDGLSETEVLALAISNEEEDSRIYADFAHSLRRPPLDRDDVRRHGGRRRRASATADRLVPIQRPITSVAQPMLKMSD
jgi:hypothetical protein